MPLMFGSLGQAPRSTRTTRAQSLPLREGIALAYMSNLVGTFTALSASRATDMSYGNVCWMHFASAHDGGAPIRVAYGIERYVQRMRE